MRRDRLSVSQTLIYLLTCGKASLQNLWIRAVLPTAVSPTVTTVTSGALATLPRSLPAISSFDPTKITTSGHCWASPLDCAPYQSLWALHHGHHGLHHGHHGHHGQLEVTSQRALQQLAQDANAKPPTSTNGFPNKHLRNHLGSGEEKLGSWGLLPPSLRPSRRGPTAHGAGFCQDRRRGTTSTTSRDSSSLCGDNDDDDDDDDDRDKMAMMMTRIIFVFVFLSMSVPVPQRHNHGLIVSAHILSSALRWYLQWWRRKWW